MAADKYDILIAGAGIGGLTAALALLRSGHRVRLFDQASQLREIGAGVQIGPNGTRLLIGLGLRHGLIAGEIEDKVVLNAALIAAAQAVEHYEMARYGTLVAWAKVIKRNDVARILNMNLNEEKATDKKLGGIAKRKINAKAAARKLKKPSRSERAENAMLAAAAGIPAI